MKASSEREDHLRKGSQISPVQSLIAGSISGAIARAVAAPLDTIKIRFQLSSLRHENQSGTQIVTNLLRNEGVKALWKGNVPAELLYVLYGATQFTSYSVLNKKFAQAQDSMNISLSKPIHSFVVGCATGVVSTVITYPFDLLRTRLAASEAKSFLSMSDTCKSVYKNLGVAGFFIGIKPTLVSMLASSGIFFGSYSVARTAFEDLEKQTGTHLWGVEAMSGLVAGVTAKALTFPMDTLRKQMQVSQNNRAIELFLDHFKRYGPKSFYRGFTIGLIKTAPTSAVSMAIYEYAITTTNIVAEAL